MGEATQMRQLLVALFTLGGYGWLYVRGGRSSRWLRWLCAGLVLATGCNVLAVWSQVWSKWMWMAFVSYPSALACGYGGEATVTKLSRRSLFGLLVGMASAPFLLPLHRPSALLVQIAVSVAGSVYFGLRNPTSAVGEEGVIGLASVLVVPFLLIR